MPKFYRQNKKRIDPRYFLNETTNRDLMEILPGERGGMPNMNLDMSQLNKHKQLICSQKDMIMLAIDNLSPGMASAAMVAAVPKLSTIEPVLEVLISLYQNNDEIKPVLKTAVSGMCMMPDIPDIPLPV